VLTASGSGGALTVVDRLAAYRVQHLSHAMDRVRCWRRGALGYLHAATRRRPSVSEVPRSIRQLMTVRPLRTRRMANPLVARYQRSWHRRPCALASPSRPGPMTSPIRFHWPEGRRPGRRRAPKPHPMAAPGGKRMCWSPLGRGPAIGTLKKPSAASAASSAATSFTNQATQIHRGFANIFFADDAPDDAYGCLTTNGDGRCTRGTTTRH
jgi:hypothetical protein